MNLERIWAGWRSEYVTGATREEGCVLCRVLAEDAYVVWRGGLCAAVLNAYPYTSGHLMLLPVRHVAELEDVTSEESAELWHGLTSAVRALKSGFAADGINVGVNLGRVAGAGVPDHFHLHCLPRWSGDTNFTTSVAEARVIPESLPASYDKLEAAWPDG